MSALDDRAGGSLAEGTPSVREKALVAWTALGVILPCLVTLFTPIVLAAAALAPLLLADRTAVKRNLASPNAITCALLVITAYLCLNVLFAPASHTAGPTIATVAAIVFSLHVGASALPAVSERHVQLMRKGLVIGFAIAVSFLGFEYMTGMAIQRAVAHAPAALGIKAGGLEHEPRLTGMTRNLTVLIMLLWLSCAVALMTMRIPARRWLAAAFMALTGLSAMLSPSATAKIGFVAGGVAWAIALHAPRIASVLLHVAWAVASLCIVPLAQLVHKLRLFDLMWIPSSGRHRLMIWSASAEWFWKTPLMGLGVGGARQTDLNAELQLSSKGLDSLSLDWHAHNMFLQTWLETGAVGGVLLFVLGLLLLRATARAPSQVQPAVYASFTSIFFIGLTGFSLWAAWYLAAFGIVGAFALLAAVTPRGEPAMAKHACG